MSRFKDFFKGFFRIGDSKSTTPDPEHKKETASSVQMKSADDVAGSTIALKLKNAQNSSAISPLEESKTHNSSPQQTPLKIADAGRTLILFNTVAKGEITQQKKSPGQEQTLPQTGIPQGVTAAFVQQLLNQRQAEIAQAREQAVIQNKQDFAPFIFRLTCKKCGLHGEIEEYTASFVCPKCGGEMLLCEIRLEEAHRDNPDTKKALAELWDNYTRDSRAKHQWDLLCASRDLDLIDMMLNICHKINGDNKDQAFRVIDSLLNAKQKLPSTAKPPSNTRSQTDKMPSFTITPLTEPVEKPARVGYKRTFCYRCHVGISYPVVMDGRRIACPACQCTLQLPGVTNKYESSGHIKKADVGTGTEILEKDGATVYSLQEVNDFLQMALDDRISEVRSKSYHSKYPEANFDLQETFNQYFSIENFYKSELVVFSLLKMLFCIYSKNIKSAGVKITEHSIVFKKNPNCQVVIFPNIILCRNESTIITRALGSISWSMGENMVQQTASVSAYRTTWRHTRNDGGPDRRYSYNPQLQVPSVYDLGVDINYLCKLTIEDWSWEFSVGALNLKQLISLTEAWNSLSGKIERK